jgi:hypothetical protein
MSVMPAGVNSPVFPVNGEHESVHISPQRDDRTRLATVESAGDAGFPDAGSD